MAQRFGRNKRRRLHEEAERMAQELRIAKIEVEIEAIRKSGLKRDQSSPASIMRMSVEMSAP